MAAIPLPGALAADWACRTGYPDNPAQCGYGFGPLCQPHRYCVNAQPPMCLVAVIDPTATPATGVCSGADTGTTCDLNATTAAPDGVLCCASDADCPAAPAYGSPAASCGSPACQNGYCTLRGPTSVVTPLSDAIGQPCCRTSADCATDNPCTSAFCGADWHCRTQAIPGCCKLGAVPCPGSQSCHQPALAPQGLCTQPCASDGDCNLHDCVARECSAGLCKLKVDGTGQPLGTTAGCCRTDADCPVASAGTHCDPVTNACTTPVAGACTGSNACPVLSGQIPVCAACVGACAGCLDRTAIADGLCQNCKVAACKATGFTCVSSYLTTACTAGLNDTCTAANPLYFCNSASGQCTLKSCDDGNECTVDVRQPDLSCGHSNVSGTVCNDRDACTVADTCMAGACLAGGPACNDGNPGTTDRCNGQSGKAVCTYFAKCDDNNDCTTDTYQNGACAYAAKAQGTACEDGLTCTTGDVCDANGHCAGTDLLFEKHFDHLYYSTGTTVAYGTDVGQGIAAGPTGLLAVGRSHGKAWMVGTTWTGNEVCRRATGSQDAAASGGLNAVVLVPTPNGQGSRYAAVGWESLSGSPMDGHGVLVFADLAPAGPTPMPEQHMLCNTPAPQLDFDNYFTPTITEEDKFVSILSGSQGLLLAGSSFHGGARPWLVWTGLDGTVQWNYVDGDTKPGAAPYDYYESTGPAATANLGANVYAAAATTAGSVVLVGSQAGPGNVTRWWMSSYAPGATAGVRQWRLSAGPPITGSTSELFGVVADATGGVIAVGYYRTPSGDNDILLVRVTGVGTVTEQRVFADGGTNYQASTVVRFADQSLAIGGQTMNVDGGFLRRLNTNGASSWSSELKPAWPSQPGAAVRAAIPVGVSTLALTGTYYVPAATQDVVIKTVDVGGNGSCAASKGCFEQPFRDKPTDSICLDHKCTAGTWQNVDNTDACTLSGADQCFWGQCAIGVCAKISTGGGQFLAKWNGAACDDGNECTTQDKCSGTGVCAAVFKSGACGLANKDCSAGACQDGAPPYCLPTLLEGDPCTSGACTSAGSGLCAQQQCVGGVAAIASPSPCGPNALCAGTRCMTHP